MGLGLWVLHSQLCLSVPARRCGVFGILMGKRVYQYVSEKAMR
jgi:hypothetical protein